MFEEMQFWVPGKPATSGSKTAGVTKNGRRFVRPANKRQKSWQNQVATCAAEVMGSIPPTVEPVTMTVRAYVPRPKSHYGSGRNAGRLKSSAPAFPTVKPDLTKMVRALEDAMTGIVWRDDAQVVDQNIKKRYATKGPGVSVAVFVMRSASS